jgi:hypothetical protein
LWRVIYELRPKRWAVTGLVSGFEVYLFLIMVTWLRKEI